MDEQEILREEKENGLFCDKCKKKVPWRTLTLGLKSCCDECLLELVEYVKEWYQ